MRRKRREKPEPTIALINVVFLMLVFFLVAGKIAQPLDRDLTLVRTAELPPTAPPDALIIGADGTLSYRGAALTDPETHISRLDPQNQETVRIVPDRDLPAATLIEIGTQLQAAGAKQVMIVTQQAVRESEEGDQP